LSDRTGEGVLFVPTPAGTQGMTFQQFTSLVRGSSIIDCSVRRDAKIWIELSGGRWLIVLSEEANSRLNLEFENPSGWQTPIPVVLDSSSGATFADYCRKVCALSRLFTIIMCLQSGNEEALSELLVHGEESPLDSLLANEDRLDFASSGQGSWIFDLIPKSKAAFKALYLIAISVSKEGRNQVFRRLEAETQIKESKAEQETLVTEKAKIQIRKERAALINAQLKSAKSLIDFYDKHIADRNPSDPIRSSFIKEFGVLMNHADPIE
jgi:hypothetical protein